MNHRDQQKIGINISILERVMKIYFNQGLADMDIGWGQQYALEIIYENPGITALELAGYLYVDKATITKLMKKLGELNYIDIRIDEEDRRIRHLYTTDLAIPVVERIKEIQSEFELDILAGFDAEKERLADKILQQMILNLTQKSRNKLEKPYLERETV